MNQTGRTSKHINKYTHGKKKNGEAKKINSPAYKHGFDWHWCRWHDKSLIIRIHLFKLQIKQVVLHAKNELLRTFSKILVQIWKSCFTQISDFSTLTFLWPKFLPRLARIREHVWIFHFSTLVHPILSRRTRGLKSWGFFGFDLGQFRSGSLFQAGLIPLNLKPIAKLSSRMRKCIKKNAGWEEVRAK